MGEEHFIEFTAVVGPIPPPFKLHTPDGNTAHGIRAERLFDAVHNIEDDIDASAKIVTEDELDTRVAALKLRAENGRLRAVLETLNARYVDHLDECAVHADYPCDCGLDDVLRQRQLDVSPELADE
jgi:hypothetical protein